MSTHPSFTWSETSGVGAIDSTGLYTAPYSTCSATIQAAVGGVSNTATITVTNAPPTIATHASGDTFPRHRPHHRSPPSSGSRMMAAENNLHPPPGPSPRSLRPPAIRSSTPNNGSNAGKNTTVTFDTAGSYTFLVTIDDGTNQVTDSVTVVVYQTLTTITVSPSSTTLNENQTQQFSAVAYDQFHNAMTAQPSFTWSKTSGIGAIDGTGLYTAPYGTGGAVIQAASGIINGSASITVNNAAPTIATHAAAAPSPVTGTTTALSVLGADDGGENNLTYTWIPPPPAPHSSNPQFSASNGNERVREEARPSPSTRPATTRSQVTMDDGAQPDPADSVTNVVVDQTLTTIDVSPATQTLNENQTQQFTATGKDQFGDLLSSQPTFTWSVTSGIGSVDGTGLYTAPYGIGIAQIQAASRRHQQHRHHHRRPTLAPHHRHAHASTPPLPPSSARPPSSPFSAPTMAAKTTSPTPGPSPPAPPPAIRSSVPAMARTPEKAQPSPSTRPAATPSRSPSTTAPIKSPTASP